VVVRGQGEYVTAIVIALVTAMFSYLAIQWISYLATISRGVEEDILRFRERLTVVYPYNGNSSLVLIINEWSRSSTIKGFIVMSENSEFTYFNDSFSLSMGSSTVRSLPAEVSLGVHKLCIYTQHLNIFCNDDRPLHKNSTMSSLDEVGYLVGSVASCTAILSKLLPDTDLFNILSAYHSYNCSLTQLPLPKGGDPFISTKYVFYRLPYITIEYSFSNGVISYSVKGDGATWSIGSISFSDLNPPTSILLTSKSIEYSLGVAKLVYTVDVYMDVEEKGTMKIVNKDYRYVKAVTRLEIKQLVESSDYILTVSKRGYPSGYGGDYDTTTNEYYLLKALAGAFVSQQWALRGYNYYDNGWSVFMSFKHLTILSGYYSTVQNWQTPGIYNQWSVNLCDPQAYNLSKSPSSIAVIRSGWRGPWLAGYGIPSSSVQNAMAETAKYIFETSSTITFSIWNYDFSYSPPYRVEIRPWLRYEGDNTLFTFLMKKYR